MAFRSLLLVSTSGIALLTARVPVEEEWRKADTGPQKLIGRDDFLHDVVTNVSRLKL